jgi:hypothetical protein
MPMLRLGCLASLALALAACATHIHPLQGRLVDTRSMAFAGREALIAEAASTPYVILGEKHDNAGHHRLQREIVAAMLARGARPALAFAFEQFDRERQEAISAAQAAPRPDAEAIAAAGRLDRKAWRWPEYAPLVVLALDRGLPIVAARSRRAAVPARGNARAERRVPGDRREHPGRAALRRHRKLRLRVVYRAAAARGSLRRAAARRAGAMDMLSASHSASPVDSQPQDCQPTREVTCKSAGGGISPQ